MEIKKALKKEIHLSPKNNDWIKFFLRLIISTFVIAVAFQGRQMITKIDMLSSDIADLRERMKCIETKIEISARVRGITSGPIAHKGKP